MSLVAPVLANDLDSGPDAERWPVFAQRTVELGVRAVFSLPLGSEALAIGALDLYRSRADPLSARDMSFAYPAGDAITFALLRLQADDVSDSDDHAASWLGSAEEEHQEVYYATGMISQKVAQAFVSLVDTLDETVDSSVLMDRLVSHSVTFTDADAAGLLMVSARGGLRPMAVSDDGEELLAVVQQQTSEGPATESWLTGGEARVRDLVAHAQEWPGFTVSARRAGFRSAHAQPLRVRHQTVGVLVLLRRAVGPSTRAACIWPVRSPT